MGLVLSDMRSPSGGPSGPLRFLALAVVLGMVIATAPLVVVPVIRYLSGFMF